MDSSTLPSEKSPILFSPLHWGLGHTSRCVPLIQFLIDHKQKVMVGVNSPYQEWLDSEIEGLASCRVPELNIKLGKSRFDTLGKLWIQAIQLPRIIREENLWSKDFVNIHKPKLILSDNRYGLHHPEVKSVLLTHQLNLPGLPLKASRMILSRLLKPFNEIWIPDFENPELSLAGRLSENHFGHLNIKYIGPVSRFSCKSEPGKNAHILFLISGPEPQRSIFENLALNTAQKLEQPCIIVRGTNRPPSYPFRIPDNIAIYHLADSKLLQSLISDASVVICRPGYSTIMDLMAFCTPAIVLATPGQLEQEYLARHLSGRHGFFCAKQKAGAESLSKVVSEIIGYKKAHTRVVSLNQFGKVLQAQI